MDVWKAPALPTAQGGVIRLPGENAGMDEETMALFRNIANHLKWVIALLLGILLA